MVNRRNYVCYYKNSQTSDETNIQKLNIKKKLILLKYVNYDYQ